MKISALGFLRNLLRLMCFRRTVLLSLENVQPVAYMRRGRCGGRSERDSGELVFNSLCYFEKKRLTSNELFETFYKRVSVRLIQLRFRRDVFLGTWVRKLRL